MHATRGSQLGTTIAAGPALMSCSEMLTAPNRPSLTRRRPAAIVAIKAVHSLIFLVNSISVILVFWAGLSGRWSRWTSPALAAALIESGVFVANHGRCPLTGLAEDLGAESGRVSDIFLPRWLADRIPLIFGPPLTIGLVLLAWRRRWGPAQVRNRPFAPTLAATDELAHA
jgi:hypothetical protein